MAIDPKLLVIKPVDELTEVTGLQDGDLLFYDGSGNLKRISIDTFNNLSKTAKPLKPTDATPTVIGLYMPTVIGTYTNAGGLIAENGFDTLFYFDGTNWTKRAFPYPQASQNLRIYEDLPNGTILNPKEQVISNNVQYIVLETAVVGTDLPTGIKFRQVGFIDKYPAGTDFAVIAKTEIETAPNATPNYFLLSNGVLGSGPYFYTSDFIEIKDSSLEYWTNLYSAHIAVCIYDANKVFITGKTASQMTVTSTSYVKRKLSDDFNLSNAKFVRISSSKGSYIKVIFNTAFDIPVKTISSLDFNSPFPINSTAVKDIAEISNIAKDIEMLNNFTPYIELADVLMQGWFWDNGADPQKTVAITSRNSDYSFTVNPTDITNLSNGQNLTVIIFDGSNYIPIHILSVNTSTGVFTTANQLPLNCVNFQHLWGDSIHLSKYGYNAMAEKVAENLKYKISQRKNKVFGLYGYQSDLAQYEQNWIVNGQTVLVMEKLTGDTVSGGYVDVGNTVFGTFETQALSSYRFLSSKLPKRWQMSQNKVGAGCRFTIPTNVNGYTEIVWGCDYRPGVVTGGVNIKITDHKGNVISDENLTQKGLKVKRIDHNSTVESLTFEISLLANETTIFTIDQIEVIKTYFDNAEVIKPNSKILFFGDSWNVHTTTVGSEVSALRPDGSELGGLGIFPNKLSEILGAVNYNFSRGGQTSEWGRYWVEEMIKRCPIKPDYAIINYFINDCNSEPNWNNKTPSVFDFSPTDPYVGQMSNAGGLFGSTNVDRWLSNMQYICATLRRYDIKPIIIGYPQLGGVNYEYALRNTKFLKGF